MPIIGRAGEGPQVLQHLDLDFMGVDAEAENMAARPRIVLRLPGLQFSREREPSWADLIVDNKIGSPGGGSNLGA
jgi:hypothetical protein